MFWAVCAYTISLVLLTHGLASISYFIVTCLRAQPKSQIHAQARQMSQTNSNLFSFYLQVGEETKFQNHHSLDSKEICKFILC